MIKKELIIAIAKKYPQFPESLIEKVVNSFFGTISDGLRKGNRIEIRGLGSFSIKKRGKKIAKNPQTGEVLQIDEKIVPVFKQSTVLAKSLILGKDKKEKRGLFSVIYRDFRSEKRQ